MQALQQFFCDKNELTSELDFNLLHALDNLLRISNAYPKIDGYLYEKFNVAAEYFYEYVKTLNDLQRYNELKTKFHYLRADLSYFLDTHRDKIRYEDSLLIELAIILLEYYRVQKHFHSTNILFKKSLTKMPVEINQTVIKLLFPLIEDKLGVIFDENIEDLKYLCEDAWKNFIIN